MENGGGRRRQYFGPADARDRAKECRKLLDGSLPQVEPVDPIEHRRKMLNDARVEAAKTVTFKESGARYIAAHKAEWRKREARSTVARDARSVHLSRLRAPPEELGRAEQPALLNPADDKLRGDCQKLHPHRSRRD